MIRRTVRIYLGMVVAVALVALSNCASAVDLALPFGYFNRSGGFYTQGCGQRACPRFAAVGGCTMAKNYPAAAHDVFGDARSQPATYSWYAGQVPTAHGPQVPCPGCFPAAVKDRSVESWEEVGPGLPLGQP